MVRIRLIAAISAAATMLWVTAVHANTFQFEALLDGLQETPPNASPGLGDALLTLDDVTGNVTLTGSYSGLLSSVTAAHIHGLAPPGTPAGIILPLTTTFGTTGTLSGAGIFTPAQITGLESGLMYVNVHSNLFSGGEIRGQLGLIPEPATMVLLGLGGFGVLAFAWRRRKLPA